MERRRDPLKQVLISVGVFVLFTAAALFLHKSRTATNTPQGLPEQISLFSEASGSQTQLAIASRAKKLNVIHFWATWCAPCVRELPLLNTFFSEFKDENLALFAISLDENPAQAIPTFLQRIPLLFPLYVDPEGKLADFYQASVLPSTTIVDQNGNKKWSKLGEVNWADPHFKKQVETWLSE